MPDDLRARIAEAIRADLRRAVTPPPDPFHGMIGSLGRTEFDLANAVLAALEPERAELDLLRAGAAERAALLEEARDVLEAAGLTGAHGDDWPEVAPAITALVAERDRYRAAWQSARQRAGAYGEGILRHVEERDQYKAWMWEQSRRADRAEAQLARALAALEEVAKPGWQRHDEQVRDFLQTALGPDAPDRDA